MIKPKNYSCYLTEIMNVLGGKWIMPILWQIAKEDGIRFNELKRRVPQITNVMLTRSLNTLIAHELILRKDYQTIPPHVEYYLTKKSFTLIPILTALNEWGETNLFPQSAKKKILK